MNVVLERSTDLSVATPEDVLPCTCCGTPTHIDLLDAKPDDPKNPDSCDWSRLECRSCHGPDWVPAFESQWPLPARLTRRVQRGLMRLGIRCGPYAKGAL